MKVLVTGGAGFIGSHTVDLLLQHGYEVRILDSLAAPVHKDRARPAYLSPEAELIVGDVRNRADMEKTLRGVNRVYHLAAHQGYLPDFSSFASVNDLGTALLYEVIVAGRLPVEKVVIGGTQAVYGEGKYRCAAHGVQFPAPRTLEQLRRQQWELSCPECGAAMTCIATDESRTNPHNQYAVSKYAQELYALAHSGDVFMGISTSGNAKNVIYAAMTARALGLSVIVLTGQGGGRLAEFADILIRAPETDTARVQQWHIQLYHVLCEMLEAHFFAGGK